MSFKQALYGCGGGFLLALVTMAIWPTAPLSLIVFAYTWGAAQIIIGDAIGIFGD